VSGALEGVPLSAGHEHEGIASVADRRVRGQADDGPLQLMPGAQVAIAARE